MVNMNDTSTQLVQPPPHDLPASPAAYAGWTLAGVAVYGGFLVASVLAAALWHELRCLRRSTDALFARLGELRTSLRPEARR